MVQVKKDEVRQSIEKSAIDTFLEKGYLNTKIKDIAEKANVSVGSIYTYFKNKEDLFYTLLPQYFVDAFKNYNYNVFPTLTRAFFNNEQNLEDYLPNHRNVDRLIANRKRLLILLKCSQGTKYGNLKEELLENIIQSEKDYLKEYGLEDKCKTTQNYKVVKMVFNNMFNMLLDSLDGDMTPEERRNVVRFAFKYNLDGFKRLLIEYIK
ncbi:TetR/AcrR family transcriptional regulator [Clostridium saccharobutylicum]|uniref:Regulatory protein n=1 Tax=Clostridium saccharobutylicum DSM 13864 TaxID=1345695 RepID=U5MUF3_CLOSA|nr:TetR/AcrR family transcriptional regulator [Clostridium saccharobutylicum]AGX44379.1 regulatory protein [Clostridium saccharobutylicum DSM 13864]AQR91671.1 HTH-type transcriptional regulator MtrR [Clostridium saccharobutylicum]AQS01575.1 HTH-type transcriptional regulator MtrR [Clostridium saccharobutylicum]AQS11185.1 HTH-type transcriptional regulator MtrR [Clostridium saccharobutylicum]AQS15558.1 HTH-type transcriptional regulator MtrR [Clostridium saccharobutylicum]